MLSPQELLFAWGPGLPSERQGYKFSFREEGAESEGSLLKTQPAFLVPSFSYFEHFIQRGKGFYKQLYVYYNSPQR